MNEHRRAAGTWLTVLAAGLLVATAGCAAQQTPRTCECPAAARGEGAGAGAASNRVTGLGQSAGGGDAPAAEPPTAAAAGDGQDKAAAGKQIKLQLYVMSKCPFGVQALEGVQAALTALGGAVALRLDYIVSEDESGQLNALHGLPELRGNILQLCVQRSHSTATFLKFLRCQNKDWRSIPSDWERCAREAGIDTRRLGACYTTAAGEQLLRDSMRRAQAAGAKGSPTIVVAGKEHSGGRTKRDFLRAICSSFAEAERPAACAAVPPPVQVRMVMLADRRCSDASCQTAGLLDNLRARFFPALTVRELDYSSAEGKRLYRALKLKHLPALLLEPGVEQVESYAQIQHWLKPRGKYLLLGVPARFDPTAEICDNKKDDTGNGRVDCADPTCRQQLLCRRTRPRHLQVFVMSQCPYGVIGLNAIKEVLSNFKGRLAFEIHYIATQAEGGGFSALHGQPEVEENIRQLCAKQHYGRGNTYLDYIWCRNKDVRSDDWKPCAQGRISAQVIERCASGPEGKQLLARDIKTAAALGISGSPTWLANNRHKFNGVTAEAIKTEVCKHNKGLPGCDKTLSDTTDTGSGGGSCDQ